MYGKSIATPNTVYTCMENILLHHIPCIHRKSIATPNTYQIYTKNREQTTTYMITSECI